MQALILGNIKYGENQTIAHMLTDEAGYGSFIFGGRKGAQKRQQIILSTPLALVTLEAYSAKQGSIRRIKEVDWAYVPKLMHTQPVRRTIALFIAELLNHSIAEWGPDRQLFDFVQKVVIDLDSPETQLTNFHLQTMLRLTSYLGFAPNMQEQHLPVFDMVAGSFSHIMPLHESILTNDALTLFRNLNNGNCQQFTNSERNYLIDILQHYYSLHIPSFKPLKSHHVLHTVLND